MDKKTEEFYIRLKEELEQSTSWPSEYLYKFIIPTDPQKKEELNKVFDNMGAVITTKASAKGNYFSFSIHVTMENPDQVIQKYLEVSKIEGVISL